jgi:hypothetical protein
MGERPNAAAMGFVAMAIVIVGLTGIFATYAVPLPLERALAREDALDAALATAEAPDPSAARAALADRLGDSAGVLTGDAAGLAGRVAAERAAMRLRFAEEGTAVATRLRWLVAIVTATGTLFVVAMMGAGRRSGSA